MLSLMNSFPEPMSGVEPMSGDLVVTHKTDIHHYSPLIFIIQKIIGLNFCTSDQIASRF